MNIYTHASHQKLKSVMVELINFCFSDGDKEFIGIAKYGAIWTNKQQKQIFFYQNIINPTSFMSSLVLYYY